MRFLLNDTEVCASAAAGSVLLDYLRGTAGLCGVKIGCREGDCGACTVLAGELTAAGDVVYRQANSCLMPLANAAGKHIVTVEGLRLTEPSAVQAAFLAEGATQCGFCTPGFVVSLTAYCLCRGSATERLEPLDALAGNICRCTGYQSIQRAAERVEAQLADHGNSLSELVAGGVVPPYFAGIAARLAPLPGAAATAAGPAILVGGGTDLYVQRPDQLPGATLEFLANRPELRAIDIQSGVCSIGAAVTMADLGRCSELVAALPRLPAMLRLIASQPIRNQATVAGNLANASPIGDLTVLLLALQATLQLRGPDSARRLPLREFYRGYKDPDLGPGELIEAIEFQLPTPTSVLGFEKVGKRRHLDIASVNSALCCELDGEVIRAAACAVGGVAPVPLYLARTSAFLVGEDWSAATARAAADLADAEIAPISDVRGSAAYKRLLCRQLLLAHFLGHPGELVAPEQLR